MDPYLPKTLPISNIDWEMHIKLIGRANAAISKYDGILESMINPQILLSSLTTQEAVLSSKIEGTQATFEQVLQFEADDKNQSEIDIQHDIQEIINYRNATSAAISYLNERPIDIKMLQDLHQILLTSVRGEQKKPGKIRDIQNYIGSKGLSVKQAIFIPPAPNNIMKALENWENYLHSDEKDPLVQLAILKAQFELIHPFVDGNGRIGRMLVPLFLYYKKLLSTPMFYISGYFDANRSEYYARLLALSRNDDWNGWIEFFLKGIVIQAEENSSKAKSILNLYSEMQKQIPNITHSRYAIQAIDTIFLRPIFKTPDFIADSKIPRVGSHRILKELNNADIINIIQSGKGRSPTIYLFPRLMSIIEGSNK
jgi:Fic family protein